MFEVSIKLSNEDKKLIKQTPCYEEGVCLSHDDPTLNKLVKEALKEFTGDPPDDVLLTIKMIW